MPPRTTPLQQLTEVPWFDRASGDDDDAYDMVGYESAQPMLMQANAPLDTDSTGPVFGML